MYLIVGLGNPDRKYDKTKHNLGFDAVDELIDKFDIPSCGISMKGMYGKGRIAGESVMILKPLTYMNLSGHAVRAFVDYYKLDPANELIVIYDDVDLNTGQLRIRRSGSAGSHNGMKNIVEMLGSENFLRIRIGIGPKPPREDLVDYVLSVFSKRERQAVEDIIEKIPDVIKCILTDGADAAMSMFNKKKTEERKEADGKSE